MKFGLIITKTERKNIETTADNAEAAIKKVRAEYPDWECDIATSMVDGEPETDFVVMAACENCKKLLFDIMDYETDDDGICLCNACIKALNAPGV